MAGSLGLGESRRLPPPPPRPDKVQAGGPGSLRGRGCEGPRWETRCRGPGKRPEPPVGGQKAQAEASTPRDQVQLPTRPWVQAGRAMALSQRFPHPNHKPVSSVHTRFPPGEPLGPSSTPSPAASQHSSHHVCNKPGGNPTAEGAGAPHLLWPSGPGGSSGPGGQPWEGTRVLGHGWASPPHCRQGQGVGAQPPAHMVITNQPEVWGRAQAREGDSAGVLGPAAPAPCQLTPLPTRESPEPPPHSFCSATETGSPRPEGGQRPGGDTPGCHRGQGRRELTAG